MEKRKPLIVFGLTIIFIFLFYSQPPGLNILIFEVILVVIALIFHKPQNLTGNQKILIGFFIAGALTYVLNYTLLAFIFNLISGIVLISFLAQPALKSIFYAIPTGVNAMPASIRLLFRGIANLTPLKSKPSLIFVSIIPVLIVIFYTFLYSASSPFFNNALNQAGIFVSNLFYWEVNYFQIFLLMVLGLFLITPFFYKRAYGYWISKDEISEEILDRKKIDRKYNFKLLDLLNEYRSGVILFTLLNIILFIVNILDIWNVWLGFEWNGQYLKQFVHEGTYILIFSIILSIGLILFYFRNNLNFYSGNSLLKWLAYTWLAQNAVLAISVAIRNLWYIEYFALAYKRIGVIFFLVFTIILIVTVIIKVKQKRTFYYLLRVNSLSLFIILFSMSLFNWDSIIAKYNLTNYKTSFVHWDFLAYMPGKTLHILDISDEKIKAIEKVQEHQFNFENIYLSPERYREIIDNRKINFINRWEKKGILSWNYAEYRAYTMLNK